MEEILRLSKRLADYCRVAIETKAIKPESGIGVAYRDFIQEWETNKQVLCDKCGTGMELTTWSCPKCAPKKGE